MSLRIAASIAALAALIALVPSPGHATIQRTDPLAPEARVPRQWPGGIVSLPIGREHLASEILDYAKDLPQAQDLDAVFRDRGYLRREDLDCAGGNDSLSFAVLGWQKPGIDPRSEEPVIRLISKNYLDPDAGRRIVATQAFGGVLVDSSGTLTTRDGGADAPACVVEIVPVGTAGSVTVEADARELSIANDVWAYRFAYRDFGAAKAACKTLVDAWESTCRFRRTVTSVAVTIAGTAAGAQPELGLGARLAVAAGQQAAQQWISNNWTCQ